MLKGLVETLNRFNCSAREAIRLGTQSFQVDCQCRVVKQSCREADQFGCFLLLTN